MSDDGCQTLHFSATVAYFVWVLIMWICGFYGSEQGGGANYLCLPCRAATVLQLHSWSTVRMSISYGAEYWTGGSHPVNNGPLMHADHNVPCAACYTSIKGTVVMIPA